MVKRADSSPPAPPHSPSSLEAPPVFVIGLQRAPERHRKTLAELSALGIDARLWEGVDGAAAANAGQRPEKWANGDERCDRKRGLLKGIHMSFGEVGCYIAHYRLWRHAWQSGWERVVVLECDARPGPDFKAAIEDVAALDESCEFVNLAAHREGHDPDALLAAGDLRLRRARTLRNGYEILRCGVRYYGAVAYAINRAGLEKALATAMPVKRPVDAHLHNFRQTGLRYFIMHPSPIGYEDYGHSLISWRSYNCSPLLWNWNVPKPRNILEKGAQYALHKIIHRMISRPHVKFIEERDYRRYVRENFPG